MSIRFSCSKVKNKNPKLLASDFEVICLFCAFYSDQGRNFLHFLLQELFLFAPEVFFIWIYLNNFGIRSMANTSNFTGACKCQDDSKRSYKNE